MISIFAKLPYLEEDTARASGLYLCRVSSRIRAEEIAAYLGARLNPRDGYENDTCIYVKPIRLDYIRDGAYVDLLDDAHLIGALKERPGVNVLAMSLAHQEYLASQIPNRIVYLPHHHIDFERARRTRTEVAVCGYIGANSSHHVDVARRVGQALASVGLEYRPLLNYQTRQEIVDYYQTIDIQVIGYFGYCDTPYRHPTKIVNAASFGIPTVAGPIAGFREMEGYYLPASNLEELVATVERLKEPNYYHQFPARLIEWAEQYHISKIAELYRAL